MPIAPEFRQESRVETLHQETAEAWGSRVVNLLDRYRYLALAILTVIYFAGTALRARSSPFWHDEIYTILLSRLDLPHMWAALRGGLDSSPPMADLLVKAAGVLWGEGNIVSRIPAMVGFWVFCLCLFAFVRRRLNVAYAFTALLLPLSTGAYVYAIQARCYGLVLGFCGLSLVAWQSAMEGRRRSVALPVLALSIAAALFSHFYAVLLLLPYGVAELWRVWRQRRVDWPMWIALSTGALIGLAACFPLMMATKVYRGHPWAVPTLHGLLMFYPTELQQVITVAIVFFALTAAWIVLRGRSVVSAHSAESATSTELLLAATFLTLPVAGFALAVPITRMFHDRYFLSAIAGVVLLVVFLASSLSRGSRMVSLFMLVATLVPALWVMGHHLPNTPVIDAEPMLRQAIDQGPVVMDDGLRFLEQWFYLPAADKSLVAYVSDPETDAKVVGHDTIDVGMRMLRRWFGVPVLDYAAVSAHGKTFRIYHDASGPAWLVDRLLQDGAKLEVLANSKDRQILRATVP